MLKKVLPAALVFSMATLGGCSTNVESPDLGKVLDVFVYSIDNFNYPSSGSEAADDAAMQEFTKYTEQNLNMPPITNAQVGLELQEDGSFQGYNDENKDFIRDAGEDTIFTVEIDSERSRLIATDVSGQGTDLRFSAGSFIAGAILGNLLSRQRSAGVSKSSLANKQVMSRSQYSSARSRSFSGSHSTGK